MAYPDYCSLTFNGKLLDQIIDGYTTINVEGRGLTGRALSVVDVPGRDGDITLSSKTPAKELIVRFLIRATSSEAHLATLQELQAALETKGAVQFSFGDEDGFYRVGQLAGAVNPPFDQHNGQGSFTLRCSDPYKYKAITALTGASLVVPGTSVYPYKIKTIEATIASTRTGFTITNTTKAKKIILTGSFPSGQKLIISPEAGTITLNGANIKNRLDFLLSDWRQFELHSGDAITADGSITIKLEERAR